MLDNSDTHTHTHYRDYNAAHTLGMDDGVVMVRRWCGVGDMMAW